MKAAAGPELAGATSWVHLRSLERCLKPVLSRPLSTRTSPTKFKFHSILNAGVEGEESLRQGSRPYRDGLVAGRRNRKRRREVLGLKTVRS